MNESPDEWRMPLPEAASELRKLDRSLEWKSESAQRTSDDDSLESRADRRANRHLRDTYAKKAYGLAAGCLIAWISLLCAYGAIRITLGIETWSDQVLIAITTGVTVSVLAAFLGVIRGLFPGKGKEDDKDDAKA